LTGYFIFARLKQFPNQTEKEEEKCLESLVRRLGIFYFG